MGLAGVKKAHVSSTRAGKRQWVSKGVRTNREAILHPHEEEGSKGVHLLLIKNVLHRDHNLAQVHRSSSTRTVWVHREVREKNTYQWKKKGRGACMLVQGTQYESHSCKKNLHTLQRCVNFKTLRKGNEHMLLDGKRAGVEGELEEPKKADILDWEGASHQVP